MISEHAKPLRIRLRLESSMHDAHRSAEAIDESCIHCTSPLRYISLGVTNVHASITHYMSIFNQTHRSSVAIWKLPKHHELRFGFLLQAAVIYMYKASTQCFLIERNWWSTIHAQATECQKFISRWIEFEKRLGNYFFF